MSETDHSRAFEKFVNDDEDLVGLLAYARYKQAIRQNALDAQSVRPRSDRNPAPSEVTTYRKASEEEFKKLVESNIERAIPEIQESAVLQDLKALRDELSASNNAIQQSIESSQSMSRSIVANVIAWILTLVLSLVIIYGVQANVLEAVRETFKEQQQGE